MSKIPAVDVGGILEGAERPTKIPSERCNLDIGNYNGIVRRER